MKVIVATGNAGKMRVSEEMTLDLCNVGFWTV